MFEGKRFLPETGTPIRKMARRSTVLDDCEPEPFAVATWMERSFTTGPRAMATAGGAPCVVEPSFCGISALRLDAPRSWCFPPVAYITRAGGGAAPPPPRRGRADPLEGLA